MNISPSRSSSLYVFNVVLLLCVAHVVGAGAFSCTLTLQGSEGSSLAIVDADLRCTPGASEVGTDLVVQQSRVLTNNTFQGAASKLLFVRSYSVNLISFIASVIAWQGT